MFTKGGRIPNKQEIDKARATQLKKYRDGYIVPMTGKKHSEKTKQKISENSGSRGKPAWNRGREGFLAGKKHYNWKGGITPLVLQIRHCFKYRQWRSDIFTRDNFTCVLCEIRGGYLEADHYPKRFSTIFHENKITSLEQALACEEFWNINNGRTLCESCHKSIPTYGNKRK